LLLVRDSSSPNLALVDPDPSSPDEALGDRDPNSPYFAFYDPDHSAPAFPAEEAFMDSEKRRYLIYE